MQAIGKLDIIDNKVCFSGLISESFNEIKCLIDIDSYRQLESQIKVNKILENEDNQ